MKKFLFVLIALLAVFAFATGAVAAEKKATAPQAGKVSGTVTAYLALRVPHEFVDSNEIGRFPRAQHKS